MSKRADGYRRDFFENHGRRQREDPLYRCICGMLRGWSNEHNLSLSEARIASAAKRIAAGLGAEAFVNTDVERKKIMRRLNELEVALKEAKATVQAMAEHQRTLAEKHIHNLADNGAIDYRPEEMRECPEGCGAFTLVGYEENHREMCRARMKKLEAALAERGLP